MLARTDNSTLAEMMAGTGFMAPRSGRRRDTVIASAIVLFALPFIALIALAIGGIGK